MKESKDIHIQDYLDGRRDEISMEGDQELDIYRSIYKVLSESPPALPGDFSESVLDALHKRQQNLGYEWLWVLGASILSATVTGVVLWPYIESGLAMNFQFVQGALSLIQSSIQSMVVWLLDFKYFLQAVPVLAIVYWMDRKLGRYRAARA